MLLEPPRDDDYDNDDHDHDVGDEKIKVALEWASNPLMLHAPGAIEVWRLRRRPATASTRGLVPCLLGATTLGKLGRRAMRRGPC